MFRFSFNVNFTLRMGVCVRSCSRCHFEQCSQNSRLKLIGFSEFHKFLFLSVFQVLIHKLLVLHDPNKDPRGEIGKDIDVIFSTLISF